MAWAAGIKSATMVWCLNEALKRQDIEFFKQTVCMSIARDERHGRLALRFIACDQRLQVRQGRLGQARHFGTGAHAITAATREALVRATTRNAHLPASFSAIIHGRVSPEPDEAALDRVTTNTRMVSTDSAMDEINSVRDMKSSPDGTPPILPNLEVIGRDKAHGSRRMLTRPWQADGCRPHRL